MCICKITCKPLGTFADFRKTCSTPSSNYLTEGKVRKKTSPKEEGREGGEKSVRSAPVGVAVAASRGAWGHFPPVRRNKWSKSAIFCKFLDFAPSETHFSPLMPPQKNLVPPLGGRGSSLGPTAC